MKFSVDDAQYECSLEGLCLLLLPVELLADGHSVEGEGRGVISDVCKV